MTDFIIKKLSYDLSSHAGLAFVSKYLKEINFNSLIDPALPGDAIAARKYWKLILLVWQRPWVDNATRYYADN